MMADNLSQTQLVETVNLTKMVKNIDEMINNYYYFSNFINVMMFKQL